MAGLSVQTARAPVMGMNTESYADEIEPDAGLFVENILPGKGKAILRGAIRLDQSGNAWLTPETPTGIWANANGEQLVGRASSLTSRKIGFPMSGVAPVDVVGTADQKPSYAHAAVGATVYGISSTGKFVRWNGSTTLTTHTNAPENGVDVKYYLSRLFYLGGEEAGGATSQSALYWSDQVVAGTNLPDTVAAWQDDASGLINKIILPDDEVNDMVAIGRLPNALVLFGDTSAHLLMGSTPASFQLRPNVISHGCVDVSAVVEYEQGVIWVGHDGVFYFDGVQTVELSDRVHRSFLTTLQNVGPSGGGKVSVGRVTGDYLLINLQVPLSTEGTLWLLHIPTRTWSQVTSDNHTVIEVVTSTIANTLNSEPLMGVMFDGSEFWTTAEISRETFPTTPSDDGVLITCRYKTRLFRLASPVTNAMLHRVLVDFRSRDNFVDADYTINVYEGVSDNTLLATASGNIQTPVILGLRSRVMLEVMKETSECLVEIVVTSGSDIDSVELGDVTVVYQEAQEQRGYS